MKVLNLLTALVKRVRSFVLTGKEKAVVGFVVGAIGAYLAQSGLTVDQVLSQSGLKALAVGVATHILVYFSTNSGQAD